ncbi:glycosyltransferase 87 family protein [bacterium]|nr:glycosyltransferase 87 family protein [bacterium]
MKSKYIKYILIGLIFGIALFQRLSLFDQVGKDVYSYERAVLDLLTGRNPYSWTVESYSNPDDPTNHGFAYLPGLMYIYAPLYMVHVKTGLPFQYLWKIPILLADIGIGVLLLRFFKDKPLWLTLISLVAWFFNPYFYYKQNYVYTDPLPIFFMLAALFVLKKDDVGAGALYAVSVALKTFPYLLFPIFLFKSKNKKDFLLAGLMAGFVFVLPFLKSVADFTTFLNGAIFVHGNRFIQGRPFLFYISYFYNVELFQIIPFKVYTLLASFSGWVVCTILYLKKWLRNRYVLSLISFGLFYLFTPVLNRTYLMWAVPVFLIGSYELVKNKKAVVYFSLVVSAWSFYYWYLAQWKDGFHIWRP